MSSLPEVTALLAFAAAGAYWMAAMRSKELAREAGRRACREARVQFLDDTVQLVRVRLRRDRYGRLAFYREYRFEYTADGDRRQHGELAMLGARVLHVSLDPDRERPRLH